jgi:hypothetical protein
VLPAPEPPPLVVVLQEDHLRALTPPRIRLVWSTLIYCNKCLADLVVVAGLARGPRRLLPLLTRDLLKSASRFNYRLVFSSVAIAHLRLTNRATLFLCFSEQQLQDMGFSNASQNVRALLATGGNVHAAIEYILGGGGL